MGLEQEPQAGLRPHGAPAARRSGLDSGSAAMISQPASVFIIVFTAINIVACLWLMWWTSRTRVSVSDVSEDGAGKTGHVWDGDLEELNNPLPRWWLGLFIITVVFGAAYLLFYPGMGNFAGASKWSSVG